MPAADANLPGRTLFAELTADLRQEEGIAEGKMLHSPALMADGRYFAFAGHDDDLIVKVPRARADEMVAAGRVDRVAMGARTMKEWVTIPRDAGPGVWRAAIAEALAYARALGPADRR